MKATKKSIVLILCCAAVMLLSIPLLGGDSVVYIKWCIMALFFGVGFYPLTATLFASFADRGWIISKTIGIALSGFLAFVLITCGIADFTSAIVWVSTIVLIAACWVFKFYNDRKKPSLRTGSEIDIDLILVEELLFIGIFLMWAYFAGFNPKAYGTEKFMDYGFMAAMMRDNSLPARDLWYSEGTINYYYGGQYFAVFLTKLTGSDIEVTYNLMRAFAASFAFVIPFSIVYHLIKDRRGIASRGGALPYIGGAMAGAGVSLAGNMHYVLYGLFGDVFKLSGYEDYWFPSSTRYIGHNPVTDDQCIHEFPSYSFVLGDLHAHVVNVMFALTFVAIAYAWLRKKENSGRGAGGSTVSVIKSAVLDPHILLMGVLLGIFQFTNYWDFVIYLTVGAIAVILYMLRRNGKGAALSCVIRILVLVGVSMLAALPFNMTFDSMAQGIKLANYHSAFYQLLILWGLPGVAVVMLLVFTIKKHTALKAATVSKKKSKKKTTEKIGYAAGLSLSDMVALLIGICAIGLILIPEVVYIKDIYESGYSRANTMFKLTYQAFMLFGMAFAYAIIRIIRDAARTASRVFAGVLAGLFVLTCGYFPYAVSCWYGDVSDTSLYQGLDATAFLETDFPDDAEAIRWLNENVDGNPVVLEAPGDSYSAYERVSAMTGLPTVVGWYVHEWLWRNDTEDLNEKIADIQTIYTSDDTDEVSRLIEEYDIEYIFVGSCEIEKYENLNEDVLRSIGDVVFEGTSGTNPAYIIQIDR